ncbi:hypothetical protein ACIQ9Q_39055 [Streptomyces sp. NPDC094438]|uniref:hypothetical protein n=1 Tax=Streptomyces sp. NPDC094438 TaxID=3366061 RepID=UPI0037FC66B9
MRVAAPPPRKRPHTVKAIFGFSHPNNQHAKPNEPFSQLLKVEARDNSGKLVRDALIRFQVDAGTGSKFRTPTPGRTADTDTDENGVAAAPELVARPTPGKATITVTAPDGKGRAPAAYLAHVQVSN